MIVIVDSGLGNVGSILNMLKKVGAHAVISSDDATLRQADKLILPGVGAFDNGMRQLAARGLVEPLCQSVAAGVPLLGICLGMQLLTLGSEEGNLPGLGWLEATTKRFSFQAGGANPALRVPHMGWSEVVAEGEPALFDGLAEDARFYFVHSYYVACYDPCHVLARATYGHEFTAAVAKGNIFGVQFHPEKSHRFGMRLLANFAAMA
jgi:glutamine amidotransferase